jgi:hypothetical protein
VLIADEDERAGHARRDESPQILLERRGRMSGLARRDKHEGREKECRADRSKSDHHRRVSAPENDESIAGTDQERAPR